MEIMEYQVVMDRIQEIEHEQLSWLDYVCDKIDCMVDEQKDKIRERMLQLYEEKDNLIEVKF